MFWLYAKPFETPVITLENNCGSLLAVPSK
jgi:hypothetical protein